MRRLLLLATALLSVPLIGAAPAPVDVRLYTLDCGRIDFSDMSNFADTGDHDGEHGPMPVTCFLIRHGADWMLWDAGLGDEIATKPGRREMMVGLHFRVPRTLASQLSELKLKPDNIRYVGLSHLHADHSGNTALFPHATFLVSPIELAWASGSPTPDGVQPDRVTAVKRSAVEPVEADKDVFGDGSVRMIGTPGHTVGHHSLMVHLPRSGWVILT
ncbi:MAG: N-acyl homoserine lactonase family protein, partial [Burkholderiales bacterium]